MYSLLSPQLYVYRTRICAVKFLTSSKRMEEPGIDPTQIRTGVLSNERNGNPICESSKLVYMFEPISKTDNTYLLFPLSWVVSR
jgi:hypothetical protein